MSKTEVSSPLDEIYSGHAVNWVRHGGWGVYVYDPADDGPECEVIKAIRANHVSVEFWLEHLAYVLRGVNSW